MKKIISALLAAVTAIGTAPFASSAEGTSISADRAFSWNFKTNAQNGTLPTAVSWGDQRGCFMTFKIPDEIKSMADKSIRVTGTLTADMTFNNGRRAGQAPIVTIISADAEAVNSVSLTGGAEATEILAAAWRDGAALGTFDTLNNDASEELELTGIVKSGADSFGLYLTCRAEDGRYQTAGIVNFNSPVLTVTAEETDERLLASTDLNSISFFNPDETAADLILPQKGKVSGEKIYWTSSNPEAISIEGKVTRKNEDTAVTLTASIGAERREFSFTVLGEEKDAAYLFAYFTGNSANQERLFYGVSKDGYNFRALNGGESVLTSDLGTGCIRDPFIFKGEDGYYYIIATDMKSSLGWSSNYATVVYKTPDLINIVDKAWINYRSFPSAADCTRAWAPQAIWCPEKNAYMVYITMSIPSDSYETVMYRHYATDLCDPSTYTDLELMLDSPANMSSAIDGDIIYDKLHNKYLMFYNGKQIAEADTLSGEWTHAETKYDDGQLPMKTSSGASMAVEGSNIWQIIGEDKWVIAADGTSFNGGCYALVETTDFENYTQLWSGSGDYSFDFTPRHGYVIPISRRELNKLFEEYGYVELPGSEPSVTIEGNRAYFESPVPAKAVTAAYSADGELLALASAEFSGTAALSLLGGDVDKAFLWDENMRPLAQAAKK